MVALYRVDFPAGSLGVEIGPSRCDDVVARPEVFAAIPAPQFATTGPHLLLRDLSRQIQIVSKSPSSGISFCIEGGVTTARRGGSPTRGCLVAVQSLEPLVEAGAIVAREETDYAARTAIVLRRDGGISFVASRGATSHEFAQEIVSSTDASWAAVTSIGEGAVLATKSGMILGDQDVVSSAWIVARLPVVSPTKLSAPSALPDIGVRPSTSGAAIQPREETGPEIDIFQVIVGISFLAAAAVWYGKKRHR